MSQSRISKNVYLSLVYSFSIGFLLFLSVYGFYDMATSFKVQLKYSYIIVMFAVLFILSCAFLEQRGAKVPYLFGGGALIASILTFSFVCIVNGVFAIWNGNSLSVDSFVVVYSICSVVAFVGIKLLAK
ncbi:hypothetical protein DRP05_12850 [Archaeoglobales archaeon]|nr:MAG: hypothetical protein DRP05_12850 [Archaeoglobales archaeon]